MDLPPSVKDAVIEDLIQSLPPFNQVKNVEKKLDFLTGKDEISSNTLLELENFINNHLSFDLSSADVEMDLFLARKRFNERAISYFQRKIVAEELAEQCRTQYPDKIESDPSMYIHDPNERQVSFSDLIHVNLSVLLNDKNTDSHSPFTLTRHQTESLRRGVVERTQSFCEKLGNLLEFSTRNGREPLQSPRHIDERIEETYIVYQNTKKEATNAFYQSLYILTQIFKEVDQLLLLWDKEAISSFDLKTMKIRKLCLQVENCFFKLKLLGEKILGEVYNPDSLRKLGENKRILDAKYNKLFREHEKIQSLLQNYMKNGDEMDLIALEYRKTVQAIHEREEEINYLRRLHCRSRS
ncbi:hypothetical protein GpartN1_g233.t1 [Galdieria partita]|uniref:Uncharacterized protein n=1 Tax=Galdieria partita TaxID=83374 RepID=A0A9C7PRJ9_9RHOD|nr:hypothetical protein GpartN1_g233.t1 [Galdieria partita]